MKTVNIIVILIICLNCYSQKYEHQSSIYGKVIDSDTKQSLPFANIWLENSSYGTIADSLGNFLLNRIPIGRYSINASMIGYKQKTLTDIILVSKRSTVVNFELQIDAQSIDEVIIKPNYFARINTLSVNSINRIDNQEIRKTPGVPDVFRRLQSIAGIGRATDFSPALIVRGGDPEENLTLIEDIEIYSPFHFSNLGGTAMSNGMSIFEPKLIQSIDITTGGFNSKYGDKLSSVTNIKLLEPDKNHVNGNLSMDMGGFSSSFSGPLGNKSTWLIAGRRGMWDMFMKMQDRDVHPKTWDLHLKYIYEPHLKHRIKLYSLYVKDDYWRLKEEDDLETINEEYYRSLNKTISAFGINWRWLYCTKGYLTVTPYLNYNTWNMTEGPENDKEKIGHENNEDFAGVKSEITYRLNKKNRLIYGNELKSIGTKYSQWSGLDTLRTGKIIMPYSINFDREKTFKFSNFIHYQLNITKWINIGVGIRQDYFDYTNEIKISPRFNAAYSFNDNLSINFSTGIFYQDAPFYKISLSEQNRNLKAAKSIHNIFGFEYMLQNDLQIKVELYHKDLDYLTVGETDTSKVLASTGKGYSQGLEFTLTKKMSQKLYLLLNYTISTSKRKNRNSPSFYYFKYHSPHMLNLMTTYRPVDWWEFSVIYRFSSGMPYTPYDLSTRTNIDNSWYCEKGDINSKTLPDYHRLDLRIDRRFIFKTWNLGLFIEIWNLTNNANVMSYEYNVDFTKEEPINSMFGFMPMFGLSAEF
ncbi:carboxypeptidase-like regulatory domain-containing protein [Bacteroidota bacterium]